MQKWLGTIQVYIPQGGKVYCKDSEFTITFDAIPTLYKDKNLMLIHCDPLGPTFGVSLTRYLVTRLSHWVQKNQDS